MLIYLYFFGWFGDGCIGIVYLESFFWHLFLIDLFLPIKKKYIKGGGDRCTEVGITHQHNGKDTVPLFDGPYLVC